MATTTQPKGKAVLFGINYLATPSAALQGCINDVKNMAVYLQTTYKMPVVAYTDDITPADTSAQGILRRLYELALQSYSENLDYVWIHYSGHGSYMRDTSRDERDGKDECLVPSDFMTAGLVKDDVINSLFRHFNPKTRIIAIFDCCHSGTICDVKYSWEGPKVVKIENISCTVPCKVISISGCLDTQTSADAYDVMKDGKWAGAMTACLLAVLVENPAIRKDVFALVAALRTKLKDRKFSQVPLLCTTHNLSRDRTFLPL